MTKVAHDASMHRPLHRGYSSADVLRHVHHGEPAVLRTRAKDAGPLLLLDRTYPHHHGHMVLDSVVPLFWAMWLHWGEAVSSRNTVVVMDTSIRWNVAKIQNHSVMHKLPRDDRLRVISASRRVRLGSHPRTRPTVWRASASSPAPLLPPPTAHAPMLVCFRLRPIRVLSACRPQGPYTLKRSGGGSVHWSSGAVSTMSWHVLVPAMVVQRTPTCTTLQPAPASSLPRPASAARSPHPLSLLLLCPRARPASEGWAASPQRTGPQRGASPTTPSANLPCRGMSIGRAGCARSASCFCFPAHEHPHASTCAHPPTSTPTHA